MSSSDAALLQEIQRLSGAIDRHKSHEPKQSHAPSFQSRNRYVNPAVANRKYVNPAIASKKYVSPALVNKSSTQYSSESTSTGQPISGTRELVIDGVAFETSSRKLTRKDLITNKPEPSSSAGTSSATAPRPRTPYARNGGNIVTSTRIHKPRFSKRKRLAGRNNMVLDNIKGTRTGHMSKRRKMDKQCRFFTMTGVCQRGLTCPYQHDPEKIAICPLFLTHACPNSADTCHLSHDPTPARVPPCHHFANHGRCTRENCPYPHVRIGPRRGVCRDFAVVGYCDKGIDCDQQHVRECPDFAEKGVCPNAKCKLPHVIRANRRRQPAASVPQTQIQRQALATLSESGHQQVSTATKEEYILNSSSGTPDVVHSVEPGAAEEYISLTFEESDDEDEDEDDEDDGGEEDDDEAEGEKAIDEDIMD